MTRAIIILLVIVLVGAGVVWAVGYDPVVLQPGESIQVLCAGQHHPVTRGGSFVTVTCEPNYIYPTPETYLPVVVKEQHEH